MSTYITTIEERRAEDAKAPKKFLPIDHVTVESIKEGQCEIDDALEDVGTCLRAIASLHELPLRGVYAEEYESGQLGAANPDQHHILLNRKVSDVHVTELAEALMGVGLHELGHCAISCTATLKKVRAEHGELTVNLLQFFEDERVENFIRTIDPDLGAYFTVIHDKAMPPAISSHERTLSDDLLAAATCYIRDPKQFHEKYEDLEFEGSRVKDDLDSLLEPPTQSEQHTVRQAIALAEYLTSKLEDRLANGETAEEEKEHIREFLKKPDLNENNPTGECTVRVVSAGGYEIGIEEEEKPEDVIYDEELSGYNGDRVDGIKSFVSKNPKTYDETDFVSEEKVRSHYLAVKGQVARLRKQLSLRFNDEEVVEKELLEGRIDGRNLARAKFDHHVFEQKDTRKSLGFHVCLMLDESGSMGSYVKNTTVTVKSKLDAARELGIFLASSFVGIPNTSLDICSFGTRGPGWGSVKTIPMNHGDSYIKHLYSGQRVKQADICRYFTRFAGMGNNYDHIAVDYGATLLEKREGFRVLVILNDGAPAGERYGGITACQKVRKTVEKAQHRGIVVIQVAIEDFKPASQMYDHVLKFTDTNTLCRDFGRLIRKLASKARYDG